MDQQPQAHSIRKVIPDLQATETNPASLSALASIVAKTTGAAESLVAKGAWVSHLVQAAAYLNLSPRKLDEQRGIDGGPRFRKFGRRVLYARVDLVAWADEHRLRSQSRVSQN